MIITRAPLRITFGGAPTDLDSYSQQFGGFCISATINKYVYVAINRTFTEEIFLKYSSLEKVKTADEIKHPIFREAIKMFVRVQASRRLSALGASMPDMDDIPRRRSGA